LVRVPVLSRETAGVVLKISLGEVRFFRTGTGGSLTGRAGTRTTTTIHVPVSKTLNRRRRFWFGLVCFRRLRVRRASSRNNSSRSCFFPFISSGTNFDRVPSRLEIFNRVAECCSSWIVLLRLDPKQIGYFPRISALLFFWFLIALVLSCCFFFFFFFFFVYR
jgi:hypothetical protein